MTTVMRPTRLLTASTVQRVAVPATQQEQRSARPSVPTAAAQQPVGTSPSPATNEVSEDEGQRRVGGQRSLLRSSDNVPAGTVVVPLSWYRLPMCLRRRAVPRMQLPRRQRRQHRGQMRVSSSMHILM